MASKNSRVLNRFACGEVNDDPKWLTKLMP